MDATYDEGKLIHLTPSAQAEVRRLLGEADNAGKGLRLGIKGGGCSGLTYVREFDDAREGDTVVSYGDFDVYLDRKSTIYLGGITLDYQGGLQGKGWQFVNPHAANTCGCGESFSL
ncbi:MAG: iron-sulfur cluster assembly accessory protein [Alphaproteobacteria bacterium]|nr:iron-sulfur cluster assembly accessory protein [Alphaproteobacteria bacterium]